MKRILHLVRNSMTAVIVERATADVGGVFPAMPVKSVSKTENEEFDSDD